MIIQHGNGMIKKGILTLLIFTGSSLASTTLQGADLLSDEPMETKVQTAPPNVMFVLDNSGSMDWEFIVDDGVFNNHEYLYSPGDNLFAESSSIGNVLGNGDASEKLAWKSQWSEYNKIYFNPHSSYEPWPDWQLMPNTDGSPNHLADMVNPRSNPIHSGVTQNIHIDYYSNLPTTDFVVADNNNSDDFSTTGNWNESSPTPEWLGSSDYTNDLNATATFTPLITVAGDYEIYAYWNCHTDRDQNALITVDSNNDGTPEAFERRDQHATANNTPEVGVCGEWLPLFGGSSFTFPSGRVGNVSLKRDASSTGNSTIADAIAFVPAGSGGPSTDTMDIKLAHYYVTNDTNNNQIPEVGEVYLVNFVWTDANSNSLVDDGEVVRDYYLPYFEGSDKYQKIQYVTPVASGSVPDAIIPKFTNEDGSSTNKTAIEELQNFANWFSFYRRRELTAKAAISRTIADLDDLYVGYYTINSGMRKSVLPINVEGTDTTIVSAGDSQESRSSHDWNSSGRLPQYENDAYYTSDTAWMKFAPNLTAGSNTVYGWWPCNDTSDTKAQVSIVHAGGTTNLEVNQRGDVDDITTKGPDCFDSNGSGCCGYWVDLGSYTFDSGTGGSVTVNSTSASTGTTYSNAVKFVGSGSSSVNKIDELLDNLYSIDSSGGTPLRTALQNVGRYFDQDDGHDGNLGTSPLYPEAQGGACQQSYSIVMSDGYWNGTSPNVGNQDQGKGAPYEDSFHNTLADVAWKYYNTDLSNSLPNEMATNNWDNLTSQHMVTFSIAFGLDGKIDRLDLDEDGTLDSPTCFDDPYFLDPNTPTPTWPNPASDDPSKIDDMWHAAVNGRGEFFSAKNPDTLVASLQDLFSNISSRAASGASVSVSGNVLTSTIALFQSSYSSGLWEGDITSYPINVSTGEVERDDALVNWRASDQLQNQDWNTGRNIITYNGTSGQPFRYANLTENQQRALLQDANVVDYIRGKEIASFRSRNKKLGDIIHSAPLLVPAANPETDGIDNNNNGSVDEADETGGVVFAGGNDGMLHAFDANTGSEVMAYVPYHNYYRLHDLTDIDFTHYFRVDATPSFKRMNFLAGNQTADGVDNDGDGCFDINKDVQDNGFCNETANGDDEDYSDGVDNNGDGTKDELWETKKFTMLVGGFNKGGKGIYALDISDIESASTKSETQLADMAMWEFPAVPTYSYGADQSTDGIDNDLDGTIDEADEDYSDTLDNNGDGIKDETGELIYTGADDDMGYTYSSPVIVKSYKSTNEQYDTADSPWVVIFGNGYESVNGSAVLYIVDAFTGTLVRKIDTGAIGGNGLSETATVDVNNDDRVDFVYAGDLKGNMWKFDLTDSDPDNWGVSFGSDLYNPITGKERIDAADSDGATPPVVDIPQPLFSAIGQSITTAPDVMHHPSFGANGYLVVFGTGKFFGEDDRSDDTEQTVYSVWDYGTDPSNYLGTLQADNTMSNLTTAQLLEQTEIDFQYYAPASNWLRTLSDNTINWYSSKECSDTLDNDSDGSIDEADEICAPISPSLYATDGIDNNADGQIDEAGEAVGHAGWYFNLPFGLHRDKDGVDNDSDGSTDEADEAKLAGERVIKNLIIRDGKIIVLSFIPDDSPCSGGGNSILNEMNAADGGRSDEPVFDINNDGVIDDDDTITINIDGVDVKVAPTGRMYSGMLSAPVIVEDPSNPRELKLFSSSAGTTETLWETQEEEGIYYWRER